ncbi:hypothetical protein AAMO2058_000809300 [Amorphochlora amoebiformis]
MDSDEFRVEYLNRITIPSNTGIPKVPDLDVDAGDHAAPNPPTATSIWPPFSILYPKRSGCLGRNVGENPYNPPGDNRPSLGEVQCDLSSGFEVGRMGTGKYVRWFTEKGNREIERMEGRGEGGKEMEG